MRRLAVLACSLWVGLGCGTGGSTGPDAGDPGFGDGIGGPDLADLPGDVPADPADVMLEDGTWVDPGTREDVRPTDVPSGPDDAAVSVDMPGDGLDGDGASSEDLPVFEDVGDPPRRLPFEFRRPAVGEPVPWSEVTAFTRRIAATLKATGYFRWLLRTSTGVDPSTGLPDYLAWHNDVQAVKEGDLVTFRHVGHEHNMWIPSAKILSAAMGAYLFTGDWEAGKVAEEY